MIFLAGEYSVWESSEYVMEDQAVEEGSLTRGTIQRSPQGWASIARPRATDGTVRACVGVASRPRRDQAGP